MQTMKPKPITPADLKRGKRIAKRRHELRLTQARLASLAHTSAQTISNVERGAPLSMKLALMLLEEFGKGWDLSRIYGEERR